MGTNDFDMARWDEKSTKIINLAGDLGLEQRDYVQSALPPPGVYDRVVINCVKVTSLDSTIITILMRYRRSIQIAGGDPLDIVLIAPPRLQRLFDLTGVSKAMTVLPADSKEEVSAGD